MTVHKVAVVGAGTMGAGIALSFALGGVDVVLLDVTDAALERAAQRIAADIQLLGQQAEAAPGRIVCSTDLATGVSGADLVLETAPEDLELKRALWRDIAAHANPDAILATNTSSFDLAEFTPLVDTPSRVVGLHWFNPAHLVPCVEVVRGDTTDPDVIETCVQLLLGLGKRPAVVRSTPGFVANRIQMAMAAEAFRCLDEGIASAEGIDDIVRHALGFRLAHLGPLRLADLAGLDVYAAIYAYLEEHLDDRFRTPARILEHVGRHEFGVKSGAGIYDYADGAGEQLLQSRNRLFAPRPND